MITIFLFNIPHGTCAQHHWIKRSSVKIWRKHITNLFKTIIMIHHILKQVFSISSQNILEVTIKFHHLLFFTFQCNSKFMISLGTPSNFNEKPITSKELSMRSSTSAAPKHPIMHSFLTYSSCLFHTTIAFAFIEYWRPYCCLPKASLDVQSHISIIQNTKSSLTQPTPLSLYKLSSWSNLLLLIRSIVSEINWTIYFWQLNIFFWSFLLLLINL